MNVTLRQRQKAGMISLYLDYYDQGKRKYQYLEMYLHPKPEKGRLTPEKNKHNEKMLNLAEAIRAKKLLEIKNGEFGFKDTEKGKGRFLKYFENLTEQRRGSQGNYGNWDSILKHLQKFVTFDVRFSDIDKKWLEDFKTYLNHKAKLSNGSFHQFAIFLLLQSVGSFKRSYKGWHYSNQSFHTGGWNKTR